MNPINASAAKPVAPHLARRLAAQVYDALVLTAVLLAATVPFVLLAGGSPASPAGRGLFQLYLLAVAFLFFGGFWVHGGQTLGMRAWRLRVVDYAGNPVSWKQALLRFLGALISWAALGGGYLWVLVDHDRRAWHDRFSGTHLVVVPRAINDLQQ
ncbi:MAG: RDD family protein [Acidiferrobacterales bacterium]